MVFDLWPKKYDTLTWKIIFNSGKNKFEKRTKTFSGKKVLKSQACSDGRKRGKRRKFENESQTWPQHSGTIFGHSFSSFYLVDHSTCVFFFFIQVQLFILLRLFFSFAHFRLNKLGWKQQILVKNRNSHTHTQVNGRTDYNR